MKSASHLRGPRNRPISVRPGRKHSAAQACFASQTRFWGSEGFAENDAAFRLPSRMIAHSLFCRSCGLPESDLSPGRIVVARLNLLLLEASLLQIFQ